MVSRRDVLKGAAAAGVVAAVGAPSLGLAALPTDRRLIVVLLRGGADGLALVPAPGDSNHDSLRGVLAQPNALPLDGFFALHPNLPGLASMWGEKQLAVVHAVQTGYRERSHFDAQDLLETGLNSLSSLADGWLNRALSYYGEQDPRLGVATGYGTPLIMHGKTPIATWAPRLLRRAEPSYLNKLLAVSNDDPQIRDALAEGMKADKSNRALLGGLEVAKPGNSDGREAIANLARATGKLLSADKGARVASFDIGAWDTHGYQVGALSYRVPVLDAALVALKDGLGAAWDKSVVVVATEFGRTAGPNGTNGTDHGTAGAMFVLGGAVRGGKVIADWPGLRQSDLREERDLMPTTDMRSVFKGLLIEHLGMDAAFVDARVFPDSRKVRPLENLAVV